MTPWLRYLIAFVVGSHGFTYVAFGLIVAGQLKGWGESSWLLQRLSGDPLRSLVAVLNVLAGVAMLACAAAIAVAPSVPGWWRPPAVVGALAGIVGFAIFYDGQAQRLVEAGAIGALVSLALLIGALAFATAFS